MIERALEVEIEAIDREIELMGEVPTPEGYLSVKKSKGRSYYTLRFGKHGNKSSKYLGGADCPEVKEFKYKAFRARKLRCLKHNKMILERAKRELLPLDASSILTGLTEGLWDVPLRIQEMGVSDQFQELVKWATEDYPKNPTPMPSSVTIAKDGRRVRSRGECLWYNMLLETGIPFRYDVEMEFTDALGRKVKRCPDFVIQCLNGEFIIIEHAGKFEEEKYGKDLLDKSQLYHRAGYDLGINYFITSDSFNGGINTEGIYGMIQHVIDRFFGIC